MSELEIIFPAKNNFVNVLIPLSGAKGDVLSGMFELHHLPVGYGNLDADLCRKS